MAIRFLVTGGTFDKEYDEINGALYFRRTHVRDMLKQARCRLAVRVVELMLKDSLELTDTDRQRILTACRGARETRLVITHGTDTMTETARVLGKADLKKTIVLTGAMIPYKFGGSSDGLFNLGSALSFVQSLPVGVYIAMNGQIFPWDKVRKNKRLGRFERGS
ncbi:MAG: asparaginase [Elusimicrobia bacterium]|nr:MAG: asparaginase [Elusimicrobiota bacterium]